jgi:transcriptional regulator with XRE-family HTH domain
VSRYEAGRLTPFAEALVRLPEVLNVSIDHLLVEDVPRRPLHSAQDALGDRLAPVARLRNGQRESSRIMVYKYDKRRRRARGMLRSCYR